MSLDYICDYALLWQVLRIDILKKNILVAFITAEHLYTFVQKCVMLKINQQLVKDSTMFAQHESSTEVWVGAYSGRVTNTPAGKPAWTHRSPLRHWTRPTFTPYFIHTC